jgi:hypothetical protein
MERWMIGMLVKITNDNEIGLSHYSSIPTFHHSSFWLPLFQYSIFPVR